KAGLIGLSGLAPVRTNEHPKGTKTWDYEDRRRVSVQRSGVTRTRPAFREGWKASHIFMVSVPEYIAPSFLNEVAQRAGLLVGVGDFRPTYGRYAVTSFKVLKS